jgi:hypothetical protein
MQMFRYALVVPMLLACFHGNSMRASDTNAWNLLNLVGIGVNVLSGFTRVLYTPVNFYGLALDVGCTAASIHASTGNRHSASSPKTSSGTPLFPILNAACLAGSLASLVYGVPSIGSWGFHDPLPAVRVAINFLNVILTGRRLMGDAERA